jgi:hypothetical protein
MLCAADGNPPEGAASGKNPLGRQKLPDEAYGNSSADADKPARAYVRDCL